MTENDYKLLDRYLAGALNAEEEQQVQARLAAEPNFAEALRFREATERYLRSQAAEPALRKTLTELGSKHFPAEASSPAGKGEGGKVRRLWPRLLALAAALALLLLAWQPWVEKDIYATYADHPAVSFSTRGAENEALRAAEEAWLAGDYELAHGHFAELPADQARSPEVRLARGIAALETERYAEAVLLFRSLKGGESTLRDYGGWYLALTQFKAGNRASALQTLKTLSVSDPELRDRIAQLIDDLE